MLFRVMLTFLILSLASCFDFTSGKFKYLGEGFKFGFYNGDHELLNIYYNDGGIIPSSYKCSKVEWNQYYIFVSCEERKYGHNSCFIIYKSKYKENPIEFNSKGVIGPLNCDSLFQTDFYKKTQINIKEYHFSF